MDTILVPVGFDFSDVNMVEVPVLERNGDWAITQNVNREDCVTLTHIATGQKIRSAHKGHMDIMREILAKMPTPAYGLPDAFPKNAEEYLSNRDKVIFSSCFPQIRNIILEYWDYLF